MQLEATARKHPLVFFLSFVVFLGLVLFATFNWLSATTQLASRPQELEGVLRTKFKPIHAFELTNHNNEIFDQTIFKGKWSFVFFGYTSCPDVCPTTLSVLSSVQSLQEKDSLPDTQVLFISVDPARDTTELLASYVPYFNEDFIGATSEKVKIDGIIQQFGAAYEIEPETASGQYLVAHTSAIFLVDNLGRLVATFSQPHYAATISSQYRNIRTYLTDE